MLSLHRLQLVPGLRAEDPQSCPLHHCGSAELAFAKPLATTSVFQVRSRKRNRR